MKLLSVRVFAGGSLLVCLIVSLSSCMTFGPARIDVVPGTSLDAVQQRVRALLPTAAHGVEVVFAPGEYEVPEGLEFGPADSGKSSDQPVVWRAEKPGETHFFGAHKIPASAFKPVQDASQLASLPAEARGKVYTCDVSPYLPNKLPPFPKHFYAVPPPPMVFMGESFGQLARWPNAGWATFTNVVDKGKFVGSKANPVYRNGAFVFSDSRAKRWDLSKGVWLYGPFTWEWFVSAAKVGSYGPENGTNDVLRFDATFSFGVQAKTWSRKFGTFFAFNVFEELDAPGEWWLDRASKRLYLVPRNAASLADIRIAVSPKALLRGKGVQYVTFRDIDFKFAYGGIVNLTDTRGVHFERCQFAWSANDAVTLKGDCNVIALCEICHVGATGIVVDGGDRAKLVRSESVLEGNRIHDVSILKRSGTLGLRLFGCGMTVRGNAFFDMPAQAIWYFGNEHLFVSNDIHHVLYEQADAGAIYTGRDWTSQGNVLCYNYVHDLGNPKNRNHTYAFYFDDCDSGDEMYGNVVRTAHQAVLVGGGRDIHIHHNLFVDCDNGVSIDNRGMRASPYSRKNLIKKAEKLNYREDPWRSRYPHLANILNEAPGEPRYDSVGTNVFVNCTKKVIAMRANPLMDSVVTNIAFAGNVVLSTPSVKCAPVDERVKAGFVVYPPAENLLGEIFSSETGKPNFAVIDTLLNRYRKP